MHDALAAQGFRNLVSQDSTKEGIEALEKVARAAAPGFGLRTLMGPQFPVMAANLIANLQNGACRLVHATYTNG